MTQTQNRPAMMQPDDYQRVSRLSEEVHSRLSEIAMITLRAAGVDMPDGPVRKFIPREAAKETKAGEMIKRGGDWMEIMEVDGNEVCYGVIGGEAFATSPC